MNFSLSRQEELIRLCQKEVEKAIDRGDGPFAVLLVDDKGAVVDYATNTTRSTADITAHAEINLLRKMRSRDLSNYAIITNAAPCSMCMSALIKAQVKNYYYGASNEAHNDPQLSPEEMARYSTLDIRIHSGILQEDCQKQIIRGRARIKG